MATRPLLRPNTGIKTKDCSLKYAPSTLTATLPKPSRIMFISTFMTDEMACITTLGMPTARMSVSTAPCGRKKGCRVRCSSRLRVWFRMKPRNMPQNWPITVAMAAPAMPMRGQPSRPKIMMGSRMILTIAPSSCVAMDSVVLPVACSMRSNTTDMKSPRQNTVTMNRYSSPSFCSRR